MSSWDTFQGRYPLYVHCFYKEMDRIFAVLLVTEHFLPICLKGALKYCGLIFEGEAKCTAKASNLLDSAFGNESNPPPSKFVRTDRALSPSKSWICNNGIVLFDAHKNEIAQGEKVNDLIINIAQLLQLLRAQFPNIKGLQSKKQYPSLRDPHSVQVVHSHGDHWMVASTLQALASVVKVYDSVYDAVDKETSKIISHLYGQTCSLETVAVEKQSGSNDCGHFAITLLTCLCFGVDPSTIKFDQACMRPHLIQCFEKGALSLFPTIKLQ